MKFTLRQAEVFYATARHGNISAAANELAMTQSAASSALKDLERRYQTQLFDRVGKRLRLNATGKALLPFIEAMISQAETVESVLVKREPAGVLNVGATLTIGNYIAVPMVFGFKQQYPKCEFNLHLANTEQIVQQVLGYQLDIGMIEGEYAHSDLQVQLWRDDELAVFCSPGHPLATDSVLGDEEIITSKWVVRERGSGTRQAFNRAMQGLHNQMEIAMELEHTEAIKSAVDTGKVLGCISKVALEEDIRRGRFVQLKLQNRNMMRHFYLVSHRKKFLSPAMQDWLHYCQGTPKAGG